MSEDALVGTLFADRFRIDSVLGSGAMGIVYLAEHEVLQRRVAIKVIARYKGVERVSVARFRHEARAASRVEHPHITSVFDFGYTDDGRPYLVMEYAEGPSLREVIAQDGPFELRRALSILQDVADALGAAHACQVVHRDLKPGNVVLATHRGQVDFVKILDFGLAKLIGQPESQSIDGAAVGTPAYMSPEQCTGMELDHRSDIYSFGIVAFQMVVGALPFTGELLQVASAHLSDPPPAPSVASGRADVTPKLDALVLRCLAKRPEDRFQDAFALRDEIAGLLRGLSPPRGRRPTGSLAAYEEDAPTLARAFFENTGVEGPGLSWPALPSLEHVWDDESTVEWLAQVEPELSEMSSTMIEEIACVLRDRGLGTFELSVAMAERLRAEDRVVDLEWRLEGLRDRIEGVERAARDREVRLQRAMSQLEHERIQLKRQRASAESGADSERQAVYLEEQLPAISREILEIARWVKREVAELQQQSDALRPQLAAARQEAAETTDRLAALVLLGSRPAAEWPASASFEPEPRAMGATEGTGNPPLVVLESSAAANESEVFAQIDAGDRPAATAPRRGRRPITSRETPQVQGAVFKERQMSRRLNPLLLIGMIGIFTAGSLFAEKYVEAKWGNEDIWWTPRSLALPLAETRGELMVLVAGEPLQKHLDRGSLSVADRSGKSQRVVADTVRVRLNNWQRRKASLLDHAVYLALLLGSSVTFVGFGIARLVARRRGGDQQG